jgi:5'-nucleotidase
MRILVTNDDGIHAHGLTVLEQVARQISDDVIVIAPETDQSGVSHSLSLNNPLRLRKIDEQHYALSGTPTDCVIMGLRHLLKTHKPDLILSGINRGQNVAEDVTYSGTIAAAMEGTLLGVRSIALSQGYGAAGREAIHWECGEAHGAAVIKRVMATDFGDNTLININFPPCPAAEVKGTAATVQGRRTHELLGIDARLDGRGNPYFWLALQRGSSVPHEGTDLWALANQRISITPLKLDLTDLPTLTTFAAEFGG